MKDSLVKIFSIFDVESLPQDKMSATLTSAQTHERETLEIVSALEKGAVWPQKEKLDLAKKMMLAFDKQSLIHCDKRFLSQADLTEHKLACPLRPGLILYCLNLIFFEFRFLRQFWERGVGNISFFSGVTSFREFCKPSFHIHQMFFLVKHMIYNKYCSCYRTLHQRRVCCDVFCTSPRCPRWCLRIQTREASPPLLLR